jgi:hypothetical protein
VSGALAERDFVAKLDKVGFGNVQVLARQPVSVDDLTLYPLFTEDLLDLMRRLIPAEHQGSVATSVVVTAERHR